MYTYRRELLKNEAIYIAGPECFYADGSELLASMRKRAESLGFCVTLPNDDILDMDNPVLQRRADSIFRNLEKVMRRTTVIAADLEAYRGSEPDAGTVYELGMAYAKGAGCYGYTRDKRSASAKNQYAHLVNGKVFDEHNSLMPYSDLPFSPCIIGSTKIVEGDFDDCLKMIILDTEEKHKNRSRQLHEKSVTADDGRNTKNKEKPVVYLSGFERYMKNHEKVYQCMKNTCASFGLDAIAPVDPLDELKDFVPENVYEKAGMDFLQYQRHVRDCDAIICNLNAFRGYEVSNDVAFECGMAFGLSKKLYGYMDHVNPMIEQVPNLGIRHEYRDQNGCNVENFNYPLNLMFGSSVKIFEGSFEKTIENIAMELLNR